MLDTVYQPKRTRGTPTEDGDFVIFEHVPMFDEHESEDGVYYDESLLKCIADNCNQRIRTTGDWCPIVVAHTKERDEKSHVNDDPPVVGLAGPFYVADFVNKDGQEVKCIYATCWVFPEDEALFLKNPRRSVEVWPEEKPENRYFDPIAILGAETPRRDLGMIYSKRVMSEPIRYSKRKTGKLRYEAGSTPGGNNTFIPGPLGKEKHDKESGSMKTNELQQLVEAIIPIIDERISAQIPVVESTEVPSVDVVEGKPGIPLDEPIEPVLSDEEQQYAKCCGKQYMKYMAGDDGGTGYMDVLDDDDKGMVDHYMRYMCDDEEKKDKYLVSTSSDECDKDKYKAEPDEPEAKMPDEYAKSPIGGDDMTDKPADSTPSGSMLDTDPEKKQYAKLRDDHKDIKHRYQKLEADHKALKEKYAKQGSAVKDLQIKERKSFRYAKLTDLEAQGYVFESVADEFEATEDFSDDQFERHITKTVMQKYQKLNGGLQDFGQHNPPKLSEGSPKSERYAKPAADVVEKYRKRGIRLTYPEVLNHLIENDGEVDEKVLIPQVGNGKH